MLYSFTSMCCPLHGIQVHAFLVHLPQGGKLAQLADLGAQELDGVVDLFLGGEAADREADRLAHADDLVGRERSRAQAPLVAAAVDLGLDTHARLPAHVQGAYAFRAVHLVRGHRQKVNFQLLQIHRDLSCGLYRVAVEDDALRAADLADLGDRLDHADLVVYHHHPDEDGIGTPRRLELLRVYPS